MAFSITDHVNLNYFCQCMTYLVPYKQQVDMTVLDFSKAFDKVPHQHLAAKLDYYGIRGHTKEWGCTFLTDCLQQVAIDGSPSADE